MTFQTSNICFYYNINSTKQDNMSINSPQTLWINGRCHRINPTTDKVNVEISGAEDQHFAPAAYEEQSDLYGNDEEDGLDIQLINQKFVCYIPVPSCLHSRIIGPKGAVRKRLEYETNCKVAIPKIGSEGPVSVTGLHRDDVISCKRRIEATLLAARQKMRPTHFIGCPFSQSDDLCAKFKEFTAALQKHNISGMDEMMVSEFKLHVTFCTMALLDDNDRKKAMDLLRSFHEETIKDNPRFRNIPVTIKGLGTFPPGNLHKCRVLYAQLESEYLQDLGNAVYRYFIEHNVSFKEFGRDSVAMHMTLLKSSQGNTFDCEQVFNELRDFDFGQVTVSQMHLSQMSTVDPSANNYYKSTMVISCD